jgi:16S rRNA (cytosine967-C5)-methyltransferase
VPIPSSPRTPISSLRLATQVFSAVVDGGRHAPDALAEHLRDAPPAARAEVARIAYAALRHAARTRHALAAVALPARTSTLVLVGLGLADPSARPQRDTRDTRDAPTPEVWASLDAVDAALAERARAGDAEALAAWGGWDRAIVERLLARAGVDATWRAVDASLGEPPRTIRANTLRSTRDALADALAAEGIVARATRDAPHGLHIDGVAALFGTAAFRAGAFEVQDEASQLIAALVAPPPGARIVDVCAGAGGKALALAAALGGRGRVEAFDRSGAKLRALAERVRRAGASNVSTEVADGTAPTPALDAALARADRVLLDAPCTGAGTLRRNPELRLRLDARALEALTRTQRALASAAAARLAPGARLVYATCSLLPDENVDVVDALLAADPTLERVSAAEIAGREAVLGWSDDDGRDLRTAPTRGGPDAMFAAVVRRRRVRIPVT